jgi:hypothetical protein
MLQRIMSILPEGNKKYPFRYRRMLTVMGDRIQFAKSRYLFGALTNTKGVQFLKAILSGVNLTAMDKCQDDITRYLGYVGDYVRQRPQLFDHVAGYPLRGGKFMQRLAAGFPPTEVILPVEATDPLVSLPFNKEWEDWMDLRGLRMVYHDSLEMLSEFTTSSFEFKFRPPTFVVFSLDPAILIMKYYKYWRRCQDAGLDCSMDEYLKRYEFGKIFEDQFGIWIFNLISFTFMNQAATVDDIVARVNVPERIVMENMLRQGIEGLVEYVGLARGGNLRLADFLETMWFPETSLIDRMNYLEKWCKMSEKHAYLWARTLLWYPYLNIIMAVARLFPQSPITGLIIERSHELYATKFKPVRMPAINGSIPLADFCTRLSHTIAGVLQGTPTKLVLDATTNK